jgi:hypothetical protein
MDPIHAVEQMVKDFQTRMAHADGVSIGKNQADIDVFPVEFIPAGIDLPADEGLRVLDMAEQLLGVHVR